VKLPVAPPSYASLTTLTNWVRSLAASIAAGWNKQHKADGTHAAVTATTVATGALTATDDATLAPMVTIEGDTFDVYSSASLNLDPLLTLRQTSLTNATNNTVTATVGQFLLWLRGTDGPQTRRSDSGLVRISGTINDAESGGITTPKRAALWVDAATISPLSVAETATIYINGRSGSGAGDFALYSADGPVAVAGSSGSVSAQAGYYERTRSTALGEWIAVSYSSGNFTASAGSWTVDSGDVVRNRYTLIGKTMIWTVALKETDVSSTPVELRIAIPGSNTANAEAGCRAYYAQDAGTVVTDVRASVAASGTYVSLIRDSVANWTTTSGDNTWVYFTITFEVQ